MKSCLLIFSTVIIFLCSCTSSLNAEIFFDDQSKCQGNKIDGNNSRSVFIRNTSSSKAYTVTIKKTITSIDDNSNSKQTTENDFIDLQPGEEKYLGCTALMQSHYYYNSLNQIQFESKELHYQYQVVGQLESK